MHKIAFLTDIHANLPALEAVLSKIQQIQVDEIIIGGDSIGIGPFPAETLTCLMNLDSCLCINGNHELNAIFGPDEVAEIFRKEYKYTIGKNELEHGRWYTSQLDFEMINFLRTKLLSVTKEFEGVQCQFLHYSYDKDRASSIFPFNSVEREHEKVVEIFSRFPGDLICFGHEHTSMLIEEPRTLVNPGSLGCYDKPIARFITIEFIEGEFFIQNYAIEYDDDNLFSTFENRDVPDRKFIYKTFFGGRFTIK